MAPKYPQDRFDAPSDLDRVGVHRGPPRRRGRWLWLGWSALAVVVIVAGGWLGIRGLDSNLKVKDPEATAAASTIAPSSGATAAQVETVATSQIGVLNGTDIANLAEAGVQALANAGWQNVDSASSSSTKITQTVIYYGSASDEGIALAVQQTFPKAQLVESTVYNDTDNVVTVVLGSDYKDLPIPEGGYSQATGIPVTPAE